MIRLLILSSVALTQGAVLLKQLHVVTRHGSCCLPVPQDSPHTLTPLGEKQMSDLGVWLRETYGKSWNIFSSYNPEKVTLSSSSLDRTIVSAQSLAEGIWGSRENVTQVNPLIPVYVVGERNDVKLRAHNKCPQGFDPYLDELYESNDWTDLKAQNADILRVLSTTPEFEEFRDESDTIPLEDVWLVYDQVNVAKTECANTDSSTRTCPDELESFANMLADDEWFALSSLTLSTEKKKYSSDTSGRLVGGNMWQAILDLAKSTEDSDEDDGFYLYSGHYPTLLGMLAAVPHEPLGTEVMPKDGAALIVEVYMDNSNSNVMVKLVYKPSAESNVTRTIKINACGGDDFCDLSALTDMFEDFSTKKWCEECGNDSSDVCMREIIKNYQSSGPSSEDVPVPAPVPTAAACSDHSARAGVVGFLISTCVFLAIGLVFYFYQQKRVRKESDTHVTNKKVAASTNLAARSDSTEMTDVDVTIDVDERFA
jgi:Histidine phosphatase superfamily (branch 2)